MTDQEPTRRRPSSPTAPGLDLRAAVSEVAKVYQRYSHGTFSKGELASALSMSATSGTFLSKSSALREYGLLDDSTGGERVSETFKRIYQAPPGSGELKRAALAAVGRNAVFGRLLQQFPARLPDESALALRLETQERFNADRARVVAAAFRRSMNEYGLIDASGNVMPVREDSIDTSADAVVDEVVDSPVADDRFRVEVPLQGGRRAAFYLPEDFTSADARKVIAVIRAFVDENSE